MKLFKQKLILTFLTSLFLGASAIAQIAKVPIDNRIGTPAIDLLHNGSVLSPEFAATLEQSKGVNFLSFLNPITPEHGTWSDILFKRLDPKLDTMTINSSDSVQFESVIKSNGGFFKFNVNTASNTTVGIYLDKKLHTSLIRKNLLRKLGFNVPAIKYLKELKVTFSSELEMESFRKKMLRGAEGRTTRWIDESKSSGLSLHFRDVAAQELNHKVLYNLAMGLPNGEINERAIRSVLVPFTIADIKESVNKLSWTVGRLGEGNKIELPHFVENNNFESATYNDLLWMARKMAGLTRIDYKEILDEAFLPVPVKKLLLEKLIARSKHLFELLNVDYDKAEYQFDSKVSHAPYLLKGKLNKIDWTDHGYASEFAAGDKDSPFKDFEYYIYSMLQSITIDSAIAKANAELKAFDPNDARMDLARKEFDEGLDHFIKTGEFIEFPISTWVSPIASGNLILSRDIVVGNYMGTNNQVQLADTFGYAVSLGAMMGLENINFADQALITASAKYVKTYTHLKPLASLKDVFREDYRNLIVPLLKRNLRKKLQQAQRTQNNEEVLTTEEEQTNYNNILKDITKILGVGESLIITEKIAPKIGGSAKVPLMNTGADVGLGSNYEYVGVKRLQVLRKDAKTIQIYDDRGYGKGLDYTISLNYFIPIIRFEMKPFKGKYNVKNYVINLDIDPRDNPHFMDGVLGLESILNSGTSEVLDELVEKKRGVVSSEVDASFSDKYGKFAFLFWRRQTNDGFSKVMVNTSTGLNGSYISYHDTERTGMNWESFTKDIVQYGLSKMSSGDNLKWANSIWGNPANTIKGSAKTIEARYEAQVIDKKSEKEFMSLGVRYEGWSEGKSDLLDILKELNDKFTVSLFKEEQVEQISGLYMYDIHATVNLYKNGVQAIKNIDRDNLILHANHYDSIRSIEGRGCSEKRIKSYRITENGVKKKIETCGTMRKAIWHINKCPLIKSEKEKTYCWLTVAKDIFKSARFSYFSSLVGKDNYFLEGEVNGFRMNSEVLNTPIRSNGYGRKHPDYPYGIIKRVQQRIGVQSGEFSGEWLRERP